MRLYTRRAVLILIIPLLLCVVSVTAMYGCTAVITPAPSDILSALTPPFTYKIRYERDGFSAECEVIGSDGGLALIYTEPETLSGVRIDIGQSRTASLDGVVTELGDRTADADIIAAMLALDPANMTECGADKENGVCRAVFNSDIGEVAVTINSETGAITTIETEKLKIILNS